MKIKMNAAAACAIMFVAGVLALFVDDSIIESSSSMGLFRRLQESCEVFFTGGGDGAYWENSYPDIHYYPGEERELPGGPNNIAFVVPMNSCPEDVAYDAAIDTQYDPGHNLYDAAAVLKHSIESNLAATGKYNATMHAIFHMDAVECIDPNGNLYDRVKVVESLGYYANIKESPVTEGEAPDKVDAMANDAGYRDLTKLHAFEYEENPAVGECA